MSHEMTSASISGINSIVLKVSPMNLLLTIFLHRDWGEITFLTDATIIDRKSVVTRVIIYVQKTRTGFIRSGPTDVNVSVSCGDLSDSRAL